LDQLVGLNSGVHFVPMREEGRCDWRAIRAVVDDNYAMHWKAQDAFRDLDSVYNRFKRDNPHRFRSWSDYQKRLTECKLFEQGIDMLLLEMKLLAEFDPSPALRIVRETWEDAAYDDMEEIEEAAVEPAREDADARPRIEVEVNAAAEVEAVQEPIDFIQTDVTAFDHVEEIEEAAVEPAREDADARPRIEVEVNAAAEVEAVQEPIDFIQLDVVEEEEEEPLPNVCRRRRKSEAARLNSELGKYWDCPQRRSGRARVQPVRYEP